LKDTTHATKKRKTQSMSATGSIAPNFHEGTRSEYLAQYVFSSFGTAVAVPHQEDHGLDLICTLTERIGQRAWAKAPYTVQVKSELKPWVFEGSNSVEWLVKHPLPFFLCVVNKTTSTLRVYHTAPRWYAWGVGDLPERLEMTPTEETDGHSTQWHGEYEFPLVPILAINVPQLVADDHYATNARNVLERWIEIDNHNLTRIRTGLHSWQMPDKYQPNAMPGGGIVTQWLSSPPEQLLNNGIKHLSQVLECIGSQFYATGNFVAAVEATLLHRHLHQKFPVLADEAHLTGGLSFVHSELNKLPLAKQEYFFSGVDELQKIVEKALQPEEQPTSRLPEIAGKRDLAPPGQ
jgi:hypothetical protein